MNSTILLGLGISFLFLSACGTAATDSKNQNKAQLHLQIGTSHLMKGNYPQALRELLEAERFDKSDPVIQNNLGLAYLVREKYDDAEKRFKRAMQLNPRYTDARNNLGRMYIDVGLYPKAITELEEAANDLTYETPEKSWSNLGHAYFMSKKYEKAKLAFQNSIKYRRGSCFTMNYYGRTLYELEQYKTAAESLDQAVKLCEKSKFEEPYFYSALSFYKLGNVELSKARLREVIEYFPKSNFAKKANEMLEIIK